MVRNEVLLNQMQAYRQETLEILTSIPEEIADIVPKGFNNSIRWNLGHIYWDQWAWICALTGDPSVLPDETYRSLFDYGTRPSEWSVAPPSLSELKARLIEQEASIREQYGHRLDELFPKPIDYGMQTIGEVLIRTFFHEGWHLSIILAIKRAIEAA